MGESEEGEVDTTSIDEIWQLSAGVTPFMLTRWDVHVLTTHMLILVTKNSHHPAENVRMRLPIFCIAFPVQ